MALLKGLKYMQGPCPATAPPSGPSTIPAGELGSAITPTPQSEPPKPRNARKIRSVYTAGRLRLPLARE